MKRDIGSLLGRRISELRKAGGLSQVQLAALAGKSVETISNFERGKTVPSVMTLAELADHLRVEVRAFFDFDAPPSPPSFESQLSARLQLLTDERRSLLIDFADTLLRRK